MSAHSPRCHACHAETDAFLCRRCTGELEGWLGEVASLAGELQTVATRQHRFTPAAGAASSEKPLPYHSSASDAAWALANVLTYWCRDLAERRGTAHDRTLHPPIPRDRALAGKPAPGATARTLPFAGAERSATLAARWLRAYTDAVRQDECAGELYDELRDVIRLAERRIVPPPPSWYAGPCDECEADMTVPVGDDGRPTNPVVLCDTCGAEHDLAGRREKLIELAGDKLMTGTMALSSIKMLMGAELPRGTWDSWVARRRLAPHATDASGHPLFRFGDVHNLVLAWLQTKSETRRRQGVGAKRQVSA